MPGGRRKESVITDLTRTGDELPTIITKLSNGSSFWTTKNAVYPFSRVLRLRVMQVKNRKLLNSSQKILVIIDLLPAIFVFEIYCNQKSRFYMISPVSVRMFFCQ